jgi:hypothetical protein
MDYSQQMLARAEYDRMVKSLPSVSEYAPIQETQPRPLNLVSAILMSIVHLVIR